jgi:DNA-binding winged helix-turn-helix (wHTH) protein/Tol biopolymer transport system component
MRFLFGDIVVEVEQIALIKDDKSIEFEPRIFELLVYFCQHPQEAISREELIEQVWRGRIVSNAAINRAVGELRKLIEDNPSSPQWIKTVSKVGYRFAAAPVIQNIPCENNMPQSDLAESDSQDTHPAENDEIATPTHNRRKFQLLGGKRGWILTVLALSVVLIYKFYGSINSTDNLRVVGWQPVTSTLGSAFNASYDAKTGSLVYLHRTGADASAQLFIKQADAPAQAITDDNYYYTDVLFAGDGFIYASRLNNLQQRQCEIVKINLTAMAFEPIIDCGERVVTQLVFDEKKRRLIYRSRSSLSEPYAIYSYQLDTGRKQQLTHPIQTGNTVGDYVFAISPNFKTLAVIEYNGDETDKVKLISLNDNSIILTADILDEVYGMVWHSADIILVANSTGLFNFDVNHHTLTVIEHGDQFSRLSKGDTDQTVITERSQSTVNIFSYANQGNKLMPLTKSSGININPVLGNKSNVLAFTSNRMGKEQIYIQTELADIGIAAFDEQISYIAAMAWSPEDNQLVASINNALYRYSLNNKKWQTIAEGFTKVHHVAYVEERIMFSAEVDGQWNIWQVSADNTVTQVTTNGGYSVQGSNNQAYYTKFNHEGLYQLDLTTGVESTIIEGFPISGWRHWQLRDNTIYYLMGKSYKSLNLITHEHKIIYNFKGRMPNSCNMAFLHDFFACEKVESDTSNVWQFQLTN